MTSFYILNSVKMGETPNMVAGLPTDSLALALLG